MSSEIRKVNQMIKRICKWVSLAMVVLALTACASGGNTREVSANPLPVPDSTNAAGAYIGATEYRLGAQDLLEISVFGVEDLSRTVRVNTNGDISLPLIGAVRAGGRTVPELEDVLTAAYTKGFLQNPQVSVFVKEFESQRITLEGAVKKPGVYPLTGRMTLLQAIATAEGLDPLADLDGVVLFRQIDGKKMAAAYSMRALRSGKVEDPLLFGDDMVVVEQSGSKTAWRRFIESSPALGIFSLIL